MRGTRRACVRGQGAFTYWNTTSRSSRNPAGSERSSSASRSKERSTSGMSSVSMSGPSTSLLVLGDSRLSAIEERAVEVEYTLAESSVPCRRGWVRSKRAETEVSVPVPLVMSEAGVVMRGGWMLNVCEVGEREGARARSASALRAGLAGCCWSKRE